MKRLLAVLLLLVVGVIALGFYLNWFQVSTNSDEQKTNIKITVDKDKIRQDERKAKEKLRDASKKATDLIGAGSEKRDNQETPP